MAGLPNAWLRESYLIIIGIEMIGHLSVVPALLIALLWPGFLLAEASTAKRVLVVFSYEQDFYWTREVRRGIEVELGDEAELHYLYMDTKTNFAGGEEQARAAHRLYRKLLPDGVIAVDDNAQRLFVVPYLKNKVKTPVIFAGVNADPKEYGYPADNVTGILERGHIRESIAFLKQFKPDVEGIAFIAKQSPSALAVHEQVRQEAASYALPICDLYLVNTETELVRLATALKSECDAVYIESLGGMLDSEGQVMPVVEIIRLLDRHFAGPVLGANRYHVEQGALSAVVKTGEEQGQRAAEMLRQAMQGTPLTEIPITRNYRGRRILNVSTMKALGIQPRAITLRGTELVRTQ